MFHQGDLQSGITLAMQQGKTVACFEDDSLDSSTWEDKWLRDGRLSDLLAQNVVLLRIQAGSVEHGFLAHFCPVERAPSLVLIDNGQLKENLSSGITQEEFVRRLRAAFGANVPTTEEDVAMNEAPESTTEEQILTTGTSGSPMNAHPATSRHAEPSIHPSAETLDSTESTPPTATPASSTPEPRPEPNPAVQALLLERAARLEAERAAREEAERIARAEKAAGKRRAVDTEVEASGSSAVRQAQMSYAAQQRLRKIEEKKELQRILATIEADKKERRQREEERRLRVAAEAEEEARRQRGETSDASIPQSQRSQQPSAQPQPPTSTHPQCHLQILLFDGSRLRHPFPRHATLRQDVRPWIDASISSAETPKSALPPYTFKQILPSQPARPIPISEEDQPLAFIGLMPNATLVLVPVNTFTEAYTGSVGRGILGQAYSGIRWVVEGLTSGVSAVTGAVAPYVPGSGQAGQQQQDMPPENPTADDGRPAATAAAGRARVNLDFEPNRKDDKDE
ncbi:hypothetical protein H2199_005331 [Coniosporium tulheliwenetii]|uniref:Uncharacterized protein n=1 Tax=Coniosporium tulheliwenetii TaxID=3383036 RepID=A0ACC2Z1J0_9PEZI|nr:hypothetical protein H2199_005331 [Cladosporium sp. JES 115]